MDFFGDLTHGVRGVRPNHVEDSRQLLDNLPVWPLDPSSSSSQGLTSEVMDAGVLGFIETSKRPAILSIQDFWWIISVRSS